MTTPDTIAAKTTSYPLRLTVLLAVAAFFGFATFEHLFSVNSHYYFTWDWQWIPSLKVYPILLPLAIPFFIGQAIYKARPAWVHLALAAILISRFVLTLGAAAVQKDPPSYTGRISDIIESKWTTGYFHEAVILQNHHMTSLQLLGRYPTLLGHFFLHPRQKPPGPLLYEWAMIRTFGPTDAAAIVSGLVIGIVATLAILAVYIFIAYFTENRDAAFFGASYFALCPGPILFFPQLDQCYPILTVAITMLWAMSLRKNQSLYSAALGVIYGISSLITWACGVLPIFLVAFAVMQFLTDPNCGLARILKHFAISVATFAAFHLAFWALTGFNLIATFRACVAQEHEIARILINVYHYHEHGLPWTIPTDLYDFALGSGWISFVLAIFYFKSAANEGLTPAVRIALVCISQIVLLALSGLLPTETARIWMFMLPMLMVPIGLELSKWPSGARLAVYAALLQLTLAMCQSMQFGARAN